MPKLSIIIPIYNAERYLRECIDSVINQTFEDWEMILINDGSIDKSFEICKEYANLFPEKIIVITGPNEGVSCARNKGLDVARGEWITFGDADDYFLPDAFNTLIDYATKNGADIVLANTLKLLEGDYFYMHSFKDRKITSEPIVGMVHMALWGYLIKGNIIYDNKIRFVNGLAYSEDRIFLYSVATFCKRLVYCAKATYVYRINTTSACASTNFVKKAQNQFTAARCMKEIGDNLPSDNVRGRSMIYREYKYILKMGISQIALSKKYRETLHEIESLYKEYVGWKRRDRFFFYNWLVHSTITINRRKIVDKDSLRALIGLGKQGAVSYEKN